MLEAAYERQSIQLIFLETQNKFLVESEVSSEKACATNGSRSIYLSVSLKTTDWRHLG